MIIISPSVLAADFSVLGAELDKVAKAGAQYIHLDVMDGIFVPNISFGPPVISSLRKKSEVVFDVHLMITDPIRYIDDFVKAGADIITIHYESCENPLEVVRYIRSKGVSPCVSIKPATPPEVLFDMMNELDMVLVMTVEPGFGGQKFMENMMPKLKEIREELDRVNPECHLEVDGGVDLVTGEICKANGADVLVAGSAFYKAADKKAFREAIEA